MRATQLLSTTAAALAATGTASAIPGLESQEYQVSRRAISTSLLSELEYYSQFAAAAYCTSNTQGSASTPLSCAYKPHPILSPSTTSTSCPRIEAAGAILHSSFDNLSIYTQGGYVAADPSTETIVLGIRGAVGLLAPLLSLTPSEDLVSCAEICEACTCWHAFYDAWGLIRDELVGQVRDALAAYPGYSRVAVAGHSLGSIMGGYAAAHIATLAANASSSSSSSSDDEFSRVTSTALYSYASSRLGNQAFAEYLSANVTGGAYRVTHTADPVPRYGDVAAGLRHSSPEYWIAYDVDGANFVVSDPAQVEVIEGYDNESEGAEGQSGFDVSAHSEYFQANIGACSGGLL